jgi:hypothetical protein
MAVFWSAHLLVVAAALCFTAVAGTTVKARAAGKFTFYADGVEVATHDTKASLKSFTIPDNTQVGIFFIVNIIIQRFELHVGHLDQKQSQPTKSVELFQWQYFIYYFIK